MADDTNDTNDKPNPASDARLKALQDAAPTTLPPYGSGTGEILKIIGAGKPYLPSI